MTKGLCSRFLSSLVVAVSIITLLSGQIHAAVESNLRPDADARKVWNDIRARYPQLTAQGYFDDPIIDFLRLDIEKNVRAKIASHPILGPAQPQVVAMLKEEARFTANELVRQGRRIGPQFDAEGNAIPGTMVEPKLYKGVVAAAARLGLTTLPLKNMVIVKINSGGQANAFMASGASSGLMVMALFSGNEELFENMRQHEAVMGHEEGHFILDHNLTFTNIILAFVYLGEDVIEGNYRRNLQKLEEMKKQGASEEAIATERMRVVDELKTQRIELQKMVSSQLYQRRLRNGADDVRVTDLIGLNGEAPLTPHFKALKESLKGRVEQAGGGQKAFGEWFASMGLMSHSANGEISFEDLIRFLVNLDKFSRAAESGADRAGKVAVSDILPATAVDYLLAGGKPSDGKRVTMEDIQRFLKSNAEADIQLTDPAQVEAMQDYVQGSHPFPADRINNVLEFAQTVNHQTLRSFFQRLVQVYAIRSAKYNEDVDALKNYYEGTGYSKFSGMDPAAVSSRKLVLDNYEKPALQEMEDHIVRIVKKVPLTEGQNPLLARVAAVSKKAPFKSMDRLMGRLTGELSDALAQAGGESAPPEVKAAVEGNEKILKEGAPTFRWPWAARDGQARGSSETFRRLGSDDVAARRVDGRVHGVEGRSDEEKARDEIARKTRDASKRARDK